MLLANPTLKTLITKDIMHDMSNDMKNENASLWCFRLIIYKDSLNIVLFSELGAPRHEDVLDFLQPDWGCQRFNK